MLKASSPENKTGALMRVAQRLDLLLGVVIIASSTAVPLKSNMEQDTGHKREMCFVSEFVFEY